MGVGKGARRGGKAVKRANALRSLFFALLFAGCGLAVGQSGTQTNADLKAAVEEIKNFREWLQAHDAFPILIVPKKMPDDGSDSSKRSNRSPEEF